MLEPSSVVIGTSHIYVIIAIKISKCLLAGLKKPIFRINTALKKCNKECLRKGAHCIVIDKASLAHLNYMYVCDIKSTYPHTVLTTPPSEAHKQQ